MAIIKDIDQEKSLTTHVFSLCYMPKTYCIYKLKGIVQVGNIVFIASLTLEITSLFIIPNQEPYNPIFIDAFGIKLLMNMFMNANKHPLSMSNVE